MALIVELEAKSAPESFEVPSAKPFYRKITVLHPTRCFLRLPKREIVVDAGYDYDRIVWVDEW